MLYLRIQAYWPEAGLFFFYHEEELLALLYAEVRFV